MALECRFSADDVGNCCSQDAECILSYDCAAGGSDNHRGSRKEKRSDYSAIMSRFYNSPPLSSIKGSDVPSLYCVLIFHNTVTSVTSTVDLHFYKLETSQDFCCTSFYNEILVFCTSQTCVFPQRKGRR